MKKKEIELLIFYLETEIRNLKYFVKVSYEQNNESEMNRFLEKIKETMDKLAEYKNILNNLE